MKNRIDASKPSKTKKAIPTQKPAFKAVTFLLPTHIADFIKATRPQLEDDWAEWAQSPILQALERDSLEECEGEFLTLFVNEMRYFRSHKAKSEFLAPLLKALKTAHVQHHANYNNAKGQNES